MFIVSNNGAQFISNMVQGVMEQYKIQHKKSLQEKMTLVRGENGHHNLIGEGQKSLRHKKLNVTKGGVAERIGVVVTFKICHQ